MNEGQTSSVDRPRRAELQQKIDDLEERVRMVDPRSLPKLANALASKLVRLQRELEQLEAQR